MSGPHRKISRGLADSSSGFITSRSHLTQPENELKQKLNAIDSSIKISNKKINKETHELRQILYDLQRDLKVSKSVSHYVPSPIEEQEAKQTKRVRRVTVATAPRDLQLQQAEMIPQSIAEGNKSSEDIGVSPGTSTKRRRKTSVPPMIRDKILVKDEDVFKEKKQESPSMLLLEEKTSGVHHETSGKETLENKKVQEAVASRNCEEQINKCEHTTDGNGGHCDDGVKDGAQLQTPSAREVGSCETSQGRPSSLSSVSSSISNDQLDSSIIDSQATNISLLYKGTPTTNPQEQRSSTYEAKAFPVVSSHLREGRRRSLSESETAYRETFKGRFVTHSLPPQSDHVRSILPPPDSEKRTRRITVAGPHPVGARRRLNIGDIPMTPFQPGSRRISVNSMHEDERKKSRSLGRGPRMGSGEEEMDKTLLTAPSLDTSRYRRTSKVSSLPPLKEERTMQIKAGNQPAIPSEWKNLENCRYLRKEDHGISIEDIFKKD